MEAVLGITQEADGGHVAAGLDNDAFTQAFSWDKLRGNASEDVGAFFDQPIWLA